MKRLIVCCDGTWDTPLERHAAATTCTNVYRLWRGLARVDGDGADQVAYYHEGVGTGGLADRVLGGGFGLGAAADVRACYRFISRHYEPGDALCVLGFSRGAFIARSTVGMVRNCGILEPRNLNRLGEAFAFYRDRSRETHPEGQRAEAFREQYSYPQAKIHFVGVWDTVGALGVPVRHPLWRGWWAFHDTALSSWVSNAFHAVAIDEQRAPFTPTLWTRPTAPPEQRLEQVWFTGVHRDVGGGYADPRLADITLRWMLLRAQECGLRFEPDRFVLGPDTEYDSPYIDPDPLGELHDSREGIFKLGRSRPRAMPFGAPADVPRMNQAVAQSAVTRFQSASAGYQPATLARYLDGPHEVAPVDQ
ncbi:MAG TPA: DUF2235 domain-containing protein [Solirubrobacteraceae bacterium]|jgi:uncharacterized protein (DUF2235 family)|nr:DUF2235 domain-containing protein [Solirubrobacteraceae bacterium]